MANPKGRRARQSISGNTSGCSLPALLKVLPLDSASFEIYRCAHVALCTTRGEATRRAGLVRIWFSVSHGRIVVRWDPESFYRSIGSLQRSGPRCPLRQYAIATANGTAG